MITDKEIKNFFQTKLTKPGFVWISDSDIVPDEVQNELIMLRDRLRDSMFRIGDLANSLKDEAESVGANLTADRIYDAVGRFCGRSGRTVRYYAETSRFFPQAIRDKYEASPFSHFVTARRLGDEWKMVMEYSADHPDATDSELYRNFIDQSDTALTVPNVLVDAPEVIRGAPRRLIIDIGKFCEYSQENLAVQRVAIETAIIKAQSVFKTLMESFVDHKIPSDDILKTFMALEDLKEDSQTIFDVAQLHFEEIDKLRKIQRYKPDDTEDSV